jgi:DNA primase small subunit
MKFKLPGAVRAALEKLIPAIVFTFTYPRLDVEVSKTMNHLLKAPFCVHPKTGRVCVPIDVATVDTFDPSTVPTVAQLVQEGTLYSRSVVAQTAASHEDDEGAARADVASHTSLRPYLEKFEAFVRDCETAALRERKAAAEAGGMFPDF